MNTTYELRDYLFHNIRLLDKVALHSVEGIHTPMYFWYNSITRETWEKDGEKFPHCVWNEPGKNVSIWNSNGTENVQKNVGDWLELMSSRDFDPYWFHAAGQALNSYKSVKTMI